MKIIISQSVVRCWFETRKVEQLRYKKRSNAATVIQKRFRGYIAFSKFIEGVVNIIITQAVVRKFIAMKKMETARNHKATQTRIYSATKIAATYRSHLAHSLYNDTLTDIILCQSYIRRWMSSREVNKLRRSWHRAAVIVQSAYRGYIQSIRFILTLSRIIMLQSQVRGYLARCSFNRIQASRHSAATMIQKYWRSFKVETDFMYVHT
jgi:myosin heavy subunit